MMKDKIIVLGRSGQLSKSLQENDPSNMIFLSSKEFDLRKLDDVYQVLEEYKPSIIINCAAFNDVDYSEKVSSDNMLINFYGIENIVKYCKIMKCKLIHISTDYVFDGKKGAPYEENDATNPINNYGKAKLMGENVILNNLNEFFILRTSWLYSHFISESNFLSKIIYAIKNNNPLYGATDLIGSPTYSNDLAKIIINLIEQNKWKKSGLYHAVNNGNVSRFEFIKKIIDCSERYHEYETLLNPTKSSSFEQVAKRPKNTALLNKKIKNELSYDIRNWEDALESAIKEYFQVTLPSSY